MELTTKNITFLKDLDPQYKLDLRSGWMYYNFPVSVFISLGEIETFIKSIKSNTIYLITPLLRTSVVRVSLSSSFLVNNRSNPILIHYFIIQQWRNSGFNINGTKEVTFTIQYKGVWFI